MKRKTFWKILATFILLCYCIYGCSSGDFSSPESNYKTFLSAVSKKDFDLFSECFYIEKNSYSIKDLRVLADRLFNDVTIKEYKIISTQKNTDNKVIMEIEEFIERKNGIKYLSRSIVEYSKIGQKWKIISSKNIEIKKKLEVKS